MKTVKYNTYLITYMIDKCTFTYDYCCSEDDVVDLNLLKDSIIEHFISKNCNAVDDTDLDSITIKAFMFMLNKHIKIISFNLIKTNETATDD